MTAANNAVCQGIISVIGVDGRNDVGTSVIRGAAAAHGSAWGRGQDSVRVALARNGLSREHRNYLAAGGLGFFIGEQENNMNLTILKEFFAGFVRTRAITRHFRRLAILEALTRTGVSRELPASLAQTLVAAARSEPAALLASLDSHADGIIEAQAEAIRERVGLNEIEHEKPLPWWVLVFGATTPARQTLFQSGWFVVGLLTQTLIVHMIRTPKLPFVQSRASTPLLVMTGVIMVVGVFLPMGRLADYFKLQALPALYFAFLVAILLGYMALTQAMKGFYARRFGWQ